MRLIIELFRKYEQFDLTIRDNELVLLSGPSGSGKSTLFEAIFWVLYGETRLIANFHKSTTSCRVALEFNNYTVMRKTKSKLLQLNYTEGNDDSPIERELIDDAAQGKINELFGDSQMFRLTSYIPQDGYCPLLTANNKERLSYLHRLSFSEENDPLERIAVIKAKLKEFVTDYETKLAGYKLRLTEFEREVQSLPPVTENDEQRMIEVAIELSKTTVELEVNLKREGEHNYLTLQLENVTKQQQQKENELKGISFDPLVEVELPKIVKEYEEYQRWRNEQQLNENKQKELTKRWMLVRNYLEKEKELSDRVAQFEELPEDGIERTELEVHQLREQWRKYHELHGICQRYNIGYGRDELRTAKDQSRRFSELRVNLTSYQQYLSLKKEEVAPMVIEQLAQEVQQLQTKLEEMKRDRQLLKCPHCKKGVYYRDRLLFRSDREDPPSDELIKEAENKLNATRTRWQTAVDNSHKLRTLSELLRTSLPSFEQLREKDRNWERTIEGFGQAHSVLVSLEFVEQPTITVEVAEQQWSTSRRRNEQQRVRQELTMMQESKDQWLAEERTVFSASEEIRRISSIQPKEVTENYLYWSSEGKKKDHATIVRKQLDELNAKRDQLSEQLVRVVLDPTLRERHQELLLEEKQLAENKANNQRRTVVQEKREQLMIERMALEHDRGRLVALKEFYRNVSLVHCKGLERTVMMINTALERVMMLILEKGIQVRLELFKTIKSNNRVKPVVNLSMQYNGTLVDRIDSLSKGEQKRVSMAFIIAINEITNNPLLMLDELTAYLDAESLEDSISILKERLSGHNKTIICASHRDTEGNYESVVRLE